MELLAYLQQFSPLSEQAYELLASNFKSREFDKNAFIITPGQVQRELLFVREGVQMSYFESESKSHVIAFTYPPNPCAIPESFSFQKPSPYFLKTLAPSVFDSISFEALQHCFNQSQELERLFRIMTEFILVGLIRRHYELHALSMEDRFKIFCSRSAHLLQLVPHKFIASYLGIDPTNFSKLYNSIKI